MLLLRGRPVRALSAPLSEGTIEEGVCFALLCYAMLCFALCTLGRFFAVFRQKCFRFALFCYNYADNCNIFICRNGLRRLVVKRDCHRVSAAPDRPQPLSRQALPSVGSDTSVCRLRCRCLSVQAPVSVALCVGVLHGRHREALHREEHDDAGGDSKNCGKFFPFHLHTSRICFYFVHR